MTGRSNRVVLSLFRSCRAFIACAPKKQTGTNSWNEGSETYTVSSNVTEPHYVVTTVKNDLGVLYTSSNVVFGNLVQPITLSFEYFGMLNLELLAGAGFVVTKAEIATYKSASSLGAPDVFVRISAYSDLFNQHIRNL